MIQHMQKKKETDWKKSIKKAIITRLIFINTIESGDDRDIWLGSTKYWVYRTLVLTARTQASERTLHTSSTISQNLQHLGHSLSIFFFLPHYRSGSWLIYDLRYDEIHRGQHIILNFDEWVFDGNMWVMQRPTWSDAPLKDQNFEC